MGLDMYLYEVRHLSHYAYMLEDSEHPFAGDYAIAEDVLKTTGLKSMVDGSVVVKATVAYWRKSNHIHGWFVKNVQYGVDDCRTYDVSEEQIVELIALCKRVILKPDLAEKLLPTQSGFFFGGTDYDEWYFSDLRKTVEMLTAVLENKSEQTWFEYSSSW